VHSHRELRWCARLINRSWNSTRQNTVAALQLANEQLQAAAKAEHVATDFTCSFRDTSSTPRALAAFRISINAA